MTCDDVRDALALVAVGDDEPVAPQLVHHLALCESCASAYRRYLATAGRLLDAVAPVAPPAHLRAAILDRAAESRRDATERGEADGDASESGTKPGGTASSPERVRSGEPPRRSFRDLWLRGWAAALFFAALNAGLLWDGWRTRREFARLEAGVGELRAELEETWSAFAGAPAVYAGSLEFQVAERFGSSASAEGYLYARPNGWAVLFRIAGLEGARETTFDVWLDTGAGWERRGVLRVEADGVASWLHYAREPEMTLRRVHVAAAGALPGTPEWVTEAVASARVTRVSEAAPPGGGAW